MVHTLEPWTTKYKMVKIFGQIDTGELAARLGSMNTFDRRGNAVWMDDFESSTLKWAEAVLGDGNSKEYSTERAYMGSTSMKMTTAAVDGRKIAIKKKFMPPSSTKIGLEARIFCETADTWISLVIFGYSGGKIYWGRVRWKFTTHTFAYEPKSGGWPILNSATYDQTGGETWMPIKLVIDYATLKYVRAIFGTDEYDLSGISLPQLGTTTENSITVSIEVETDANAASVIYVDNVIFTQNEP